MANNQMDREFLREASIDDMELLFQWANDPEVRKNSFQTVSISRKEHQAWFERALVDKGAIIFIYMLEGKPVGQVRLTVEGNTGKISYSICAQERGKGHGKRMLEIVRNKVKEEHPEIYRLRAEVKPTNIASKHVFTGLGFREQYICFETDLRDVHGGALL